MRVVPNAWAEQETLGTLAGWFVAYDDDVVDPAAYCRECRPASLPAWPIDVGAVVWWPLHCEGCGLPLDVAVRDAADACREYDRLTA